VIQELGSYPELSIVQRMSVEVKSKARILLEFKVYFWKFPEIRRQRFRSTE